MSSEIIFIDNNVRYGKCPLCSSSNIHMLENKVIKYSTPIYYSTQIIELKNKPQLWVCDNCKSGFSQNIINEETTVSLYNTNFSGERWQSKPFEEEKPHKLLKCLDKFLNKGSSILDIGCNTGELLDYAKSKGLKTTGVEYSERSRNIISKKGHTSFNMLEEVNEKFDIITAFDLVEHLYNLPDFLNKCYMNLNKNGYLVILTGNIHSTSSKLLKSRWWYVRHPEHVLFPSLNYFSGLKNFSLDHYIYTYSSVYFKYFIINAIKSKFISKHISKNGNLKVSSKENIFSKILRYKYKGIPSIGADHMLIVLKKI